jgi:two-component system, cell cycle response regulator DivK
MKIDYSRAKVLVVDDEEDSVEIVEMVLSSQGAKIFKAYNGMEGLAAFREEEPDMVLTDISMPQMDGWELLKAIRQHQSHPIPVIAMTAHAMENDKKLVLNAGFNGYISKPLQMFSLVTDIDEWL